MPPSVEPGALPSWLFDQEAVWIDTGGYKHLIEDINADACLWFMDYLLANARKLRDVWSTEQQRTYDTDERARRWMLRRPCMAALMRQYLAQRKAAIEEALDGR